MCHQLPPPFLNTVLHLSPFTLPFSPPYPHPCRWGHRVTSHQIPALLWGFLLLVGRGAGTPRQTSRFVFEAGEGSFSSRWGQNGAPPSPPRTIHSVGVWTVSQAGTFRRRPKPSSRCGRLYTPKGSGGGGREMNLHPQRDSVGEGGACECIVRETRGRGE
jgi:hypothetical protein